MMKKIIFILCCALLLIFLVGCVSNVRPNNNDISESSREISFWTTVGHGDAALIADVIAQFNMLHPEVSISFVYMEGEAYKTRISVMAASNQLPDVFNYWVGEQFNMLARSGNIRDLTAMLDANPELKNSFVLNSLDAVTINGRIYGLPSAITHKMIFYNKRIFYENDLRVPDTYDEFLEIIDVLNSRGITPIVVGGMDRWPLLSWFAHLAQRIGGTQLYMDVIAGNLTFTEPSFVSAGEYYRDLAQRGFIHGAMAIDADTADAIFADGGGAMMLTGVWSIPAYIANPATVDDFGFFTFPVIEGGTGGSGYFYGGIANTFAMSNSSENMEIAEAFLMFLMSEEIQTKLMEANGSTPTVAISLERERMNPLAYEFGNIASSSVVTGFFPYTDQAIRPAEAERLLNAIVSIFLDESIDIEAELARIR